jgi:hypothetical protein
MNSNVPHQCSWIKLQCLPVAVIPKLGVMALANERRRPKPGTRYIVVYTGT